MRHAIVVARGSMVGEDRDLTLAQLCRACGLTVDVVRAMVEEGILEPQGTRPGHWRFSPDCLGRVRLARRLQMDLDVNLAGAAVALDLLERIARLEARIRSLGTRT
jgi:chaperone modulatory protein CbpM